MPWMNKCFEAIKNDKPQVLPAVLLRVGIDEFNSGQNNHKTGLMFSAYCNSLKCLKFFIDNGAGLNLVNEEGKTALYFSAYWDNAEAAKMLMLAGADHYICSNDGLTPYDIAMKNNCTKTAEVIKNLPKAMAEEAILNKVVTDQNALQSGNLAF